MDVENTFETFIKSVEPALINTIWRIMKNSDLCKDVLQETLIAVWKNFQKIQHHPNPRAMVIKISANKSYDSLRKHNRHLQIRNLMHRNSKSSVANFEGIKRIEAEEIRQEIIHSLSRLSRKQAVAIYMRVVEGESYDHIAQAMDCSNGTVRNHVKRGREKLCKWLSHLKNLENVI